MQIINSNGKIVRTDYDALGRPVTVTDALGYQTAFLYDGNGNVTKMTDANAGLMPKNTYGCTLCCLMIGDRYWADIMGAKRLGLTTIKINQGEHAKETTDAALHRGLQSTMPQLQEDPATLLRQMEPDFVIDDLYELIGIVGKIRSK